MAEKKSQNQTQVRPPIVAVLGHVDHGKTTLLDRIRKTNLAAREAGGITQSIGASQIDFKGQKITFIDTPGHAVFSKMRARGGQAADLVILVVAVDDGVMPQTLESLEHIRAAGVPYLVAINKIDLAGAEVEKVKKQLAQNGVLLEGYGGKIVSVPVSAKTGEGVEELLEMILLISQIEGISGDPQGVLQGLVIESKKDKAGPAATVVVKNGTLKVGEQILAGGVWAKVRGLLDENKKRLTELEPGEAAEVLGFAALPPVGATLVKVETPIKKGPEKEILKIPKFTEEEEKKLKIILKAESAGSLEALTGSLPARVLLVAAGMGQINESDVLLAQIAKAKIFGFRVRATQEILKLAESGKVEIKIYSLIYQFLEEVEKEALSHLLPQVTEKILGKAEIIAEFLVGGNRIAGCRVDEGKIHQGARIQLRRGEKLLGETRLGQVKQKAKTVMEVKAKEECGVLLEPPLDFKVGDVLISVLP